MTEYIYATDGHEGHWLTGEEIVRCRDCAKYEPSTVDEDGEGEPSWCRKWQFEWVAEDGFCAWGERRSDGEDE